MKNLLLLLLTTIFLSCSQIPTGELSGILDDKSTEVQMTKELMKKYSEGKFREIADMISDDSGEFYFNNVKVDKEGWLSAAEGHHDLFDNIKNDSDTEDEDDDIVPNLV